MVSALAATGLVAITAGTASATSPCTRTYTTNASTAIVDHTIVSSVINVPEDGLPVTDVNVTLNIHHTYDADLTIWVQSETDAGATRDGLQLFDQYGGSGDNLIGTVFDQSSGTEVSTGAAPFTGTFNPVGSLNNLNGYAGGRYRLLVWDDAAPDVGTIDSWSVTITYATCDVDGDGLDVPADQCPNIAAATSSGCPVAARVLSAKYKTGKFKGVLSSTAPKCRSGKSVTIWKVRSGADKKIGTTTTASDGTYKLRRARHAGKYYATSPRVVVANVADCAAVKSSTFKIS
jgi:subtilisin-like proprotein convertase family protein